MICRTVLAASGIGRVSMLRSVGADGGSDLWINLNQHEPVLNRGHRSLAATSWFTSSNTTNTKKELRTIGLFASISAYLPQGLWAQDAFWKSKHAYLGQTPPGDEPRPFAGQLLKDSGIVLGKVNFSHDGKAFYYSYAAHWFDDSRSGTKMIRFDGKQWGKPEVIAEKITNPALSADGQRLYLGGSNGQVWILDKAGSGWSKPRLWMEKPYGLYNFQPTGSGVFYTGSNGTRGSKQDWSTYDFCKLTIRGKDTLIARLGNVINTPGFDGDFYIAPDESYIIVSAKETKAISGGISGWIH